jgi:hypothetical protein
LVEIIVERAILVEVRGRRIEQQAGLVAAQVGGPLDDQRQLDRLVEPDQARRDDAQDRPLEGHNRRGARHTGKDAEHKHEQQRHRRGSAGPVEGRTMQ